MEGVIIKQALSMLGQPTEFLLTKFLFTPIKQDLKQLR